ncbi:neuroblastoma-amplified sequence-like isoform X2 [Trichoplusia ni]|uniref:Neuroblastoma-amplified sequence-like isoform X2 n=1 Tax=Trichoplusia ni TaxID=7111 RepID=A0A7E5VU10_TRINI|nr:neuroblastoma-amplified sequence-like isoform X2 [Trichoplusia ni]
MEEKKSILHELYVFSEWKPEPEYIQKPDSLLPENISAFWKWLNFFGPKKNLIDGVAAHLEKQQKWHIALGDEGKVIAVLTDNILEIRTKRSEYATIAARTTVSRDAYPQWRKLVWSPDCSFVVLAYGNGVVSFFDLTASNLFNIPIDCSRPGGLECTDNTHAVADIIFMPLRVKDTKWNWEVLVVTYDGKLRGYLVSQTDGCKLHHSFRFAGGVAALKYCAPHATLYVAGVPTGSAKDPTSPLHAGITAWRILNDEPFYKLSVVSDELEAHANDRFKLYVPFGYKKSAFIVQMELSPDATKLVCLHCNGDVSVWRLPLLKLVYRWPLNNQPHFDLRNPLTGAEKPGKKNLALCHPADINWWSNEEIIVSRFSGAVTICDLETMSNILGKKPEFFQGSPQITCAHDGTFMVLECESNVLPAKKSRSDESMEVVRVESEAEDTVLELARELLKWVLFGITDMEAFQPRPRRITVVSRVYRLLGLKSTTPTELFSRKIESGNYNEALALADTFNLDSDLVYQQQWRKNPVSTDAIQKYLSKVSKKIWAVHQCVDRLPETLPAAKELLQFGLELTNDTIMDEINKEQIDPLTEADDITLEHLNAYTSELLRCRHVMLFYKERLKLYESILRCEKSTYVKDEYDRLRSNSVVHSAMEIAKEGRIEALTCLWPHIKTIAMQLAVLEKLPETINPLEYQHLLPTKHPFQWFDKGSPVKVPPTVIEHDWCRKEIFRSIWSSNWSEDLTPESETAGEIPAITDDVAKWYDKRAREIEERSGLVSHALTLVTLATVGGGVEGLDDIMFHLLTLDTLIYDINVEGVTLDELQKMTILETCTMLMKMSTPLTFVADLKQFVIPFLKRFENLTKRTDSCLSGLTDYLESISVTDLSFILLVLQSPSEFELDVRTHLELAERCLFAHTGTEQLDKACDLLDTLLKETDGSISGSELVRRAKEIERLVSGSSRLAWRGLRVPPRELRDLRDDHKHVYNLLTRLARTLALGEEKPTQQDWEKLLKDILELQSTLFDCITKEQCHEIYASALLTSGDIPSIKLASEVLTCTADGRRNSQLVNYERSVALVSAAAKEYFNSAGSLNDPALEMAKCCLTLIKDDNKEVQKELDLILALQLLHSFGVTNLLPIQVRVCENRIKIVEGCLQLDPNAYLASHKLLKLATLLRVNGDDEVSRLELELEGLQQMGVTLKENNQLSERWPSTDDEFADAITTPIIEKKDLVVPAKPEKKIPLFNYLLDTFQNKFAISDNKTSSNEPVEKTVHCQEFYRNLYPEHQISNNYYSYDRFSIPDAAEGPTAVGHNVLKWFYIQNCLENGSTCELESEVVSKCAEQLVFCDTGLSVSLWPPQECLTPTAHAQIKEALWPELSGTEHNALINFFLLLKGVDEKAPISGLTAAEHIKLLKKAKAASTDLDYKLLLEQPTAEQLTAHILSIIKPENVGMVTKFLRSLPPAFKIPISVNAIYTKWLTKYFFSVPANATNKKWMQQYRQCASYFNKLSKHELVQFVADTCFTDDAIELVPAGTRSLMIMQAVDYCQQEQENDFKYNKTEQTWAQVGQELTRWARFLENFHSTTVQSIIDNSNVPRNEIWPEIEKSHGNPEKVTTCLAQLVHAFDMRAPALGSLLQCLHCDVEAHHVFSHIANNHLHTSSDILNLVNRLTQYHKEGIKFPEELLDVVMQKAAEFSLPPHKQIGLLSLSQRARVHDTDDMMKIASFSVDLFRTEWPEDVAKDVTCENLMTEEGRRDAFAKILQLSDTWQRKKALVDVVNCWPPTRSSESRSLHSEYISHLLKNSTDQKESLVLIKLLLRRPVLVDEEIKWLSSDVPAEAVVNAIWLMLLSKCEQSQDDILNLVLEHKEYVQKQEIDDELIKELLDNNMFIKLVATPLYTFFINYIITNETAASAATVGEGASPSPYTLQWATTELLKANYLAEAGHLKLMSLGVPPSLRGFSQSVLYCKNMFTN